MKNILYILLFFSCSIFGQHPTMLLVSQEQYANEGSSEGILYQEDFDTLDDAATTGFSGWVNVTTDTTGKDWQVITGDTPTGNTGAKTGGATSVSDGTQIVGSKSLYNETSSGSPTDIFHLESVNVSASTNNPFLRFQFFNRWSNGSVMATDGTIKVKGWNGSAWVTEWTQTGAHASITVPGTEDYISVTVDFSTYTNADFKIQIEVLKGVLSDPRYDTNLDNLQIWNGTPL